ncbi:MAG: ABC transporter permease [Chloroflexi bacterium]|nr:ABC transporter permease [Chloroflexota bacterium]
MAAGLVLVGIVVSFAILAPVVGTRDPVQQNLALANRPPVWQARGSIQSPLGTDQFGRDVWSRIVYGARISLAIGAGASLLGAVVGVTAGLVAGFYGGKIDTAVMRVVDLNLAFPLILLALAVAAILGPSLQNLILVMALTTWMIYARIVRGVTLSLREREFVQAARAIGVTDTGIMWRHILPNLLAPIMVIWTLELARVVLMESALSFLGVGVPPPTPTWGRMLAEGRSLLTTAPWIATFPGIAITLTVLGVNFFGDGLRDALDPRLRKST